MSANNYILVNRDNLEVSMRDADTGALLQKIGRAKTLEKAIDLAQKYQEIVEYGICFTKGNKKNVK